MDLPFPTDVQEFDSDERISFSKLDNKFIAVHDDGTEFEFDAAQKKWVPAEEEPLEDDLDDLREYSGTPADDDASNKKRKQGVENGDAVSWKADSRMSYACSQCHGATPASRCSHEILTTYASNRTTEPPNLRVQTRSKSLRRNPSRTQPSM